MDETVYGSGYGVRRMDGYGDGIHGYAYRMDTDTVDGLQFVGPVRYGFATGIVDGRFADDDGYGYGWMDDDGRLRYAIRTGYGTVSRSMNARARARRDGARVGWMRSGWIVARYAICG